MKKFSLACLVFVACSQQRSPTPAPIYGGNQLAPEDVVWTQLVNATANGSTLTKAAGSRGPTTPAA